MLHIIFDNSNTPTYKIAILARTSGFIEDSLRRTYVAPLQAAGIPSSDIWAVNLAHDGKKVPAKLAKEHIAEILPEMDKVGTKYLFVTDAEYFKKLTKEPKAEVHLGYVLPCAIPGYEHIQVVYTISDKALFYNPDNRAKLDLSIDAIVGHIHGQGPAIQGIQYTSAVFPKTGNDIKKELNKLLTAPMLTCDIEAFSLLHHEAGIGTIAFGTSATSGVAFKCDYMSVLPLHIRPNNKLKGQLFGIQKSTSTFSIEVRKELKRFFTNYEGKLVFHNAGYDVKVLIYELFMEDLTDMAGMVEGIKVFSKNIDDTKVIAYLALNTTAEISLSLKSLAHEYTGNYAQEDIKNIRRIPQDALLAYNLEDACATWYVYDKYRPQLEESTVLDAYNNVFQPAIMSLVHTELVGMPIDLNKVEDARVILTKLRNDYHTRLFNIPEVTKFIGYRRQKEYLACHLKWKKKTASIDEFDYINFNPNSGDQVAELLHEFLKIPIEDFTPTKKAATGNDVLKKIAAKSPEPHVKEICECLQGLADTNIILNNFIHAFQTYSVQVSPGVWRLYGNFNLGGTVSGRLSSSKPNLQNIPSGSTYAELIKYCFVSTEDTLFVGADYNSLEDYVSALTTRDPNKLKVYLDGYDGHALRAFTYWPHLMPDIHQAAEGDRTFRLNVNGQDLFCKTGDFILLSDGTKQPIEEFYETNPQLRK